VPLCCSGLSSGLAGRIANQVASQRHVQCRFAGGAGSIPARGFLIILSPWSGVPKCDHAQFSQPSAPYSPSWCVRRTYLRAISSIDLCRLLGIVLAPCSECATWSSPNQCRSVPGATAAGCAVPVVASARVSESRLSVLVLVFVMFAAMCVVLESSYSLPVKNQIGSKS